MDNITDRILCIGDNWTAGTIENDVPVDQMVSDLFPLWPELLAEKMNMGYVNLSCGGRGNEWIYMGTVGSLGFLPRDFYT